MKQNSKKAAAKERQSTRQVLNILGLKDYILETGRGELVFFSLEPTNISVLSDVSVAARINALMTVLQTLDELEMLCINSRESFDANKSYLKARIEEESLPAVRKLLELDASNLDRLQVQMSTAREFLLVVRFKEHKVAEMPSYLAKIESTLREHGFKAHRLESGDLKKLLGVYYEQNVTTDRFEDSDGERWVLV